MGDVGEGGIFLLRLVFWAEIPGRSGRLWGFRLVSAGDWALWTAERKRRNFRGGEVRR